VPLFIETEGFFGVRSALLNVELQKCNIGNSEYINVTVQRGMDMGGLSRESTKSAKP
jgi:hypothetical protein